MNSKTQQIKDREALRHIRNWLIHRGKSPSVRDLQKLLKYNSPRSAALVLERLMKSGIIRRRPDGTLQLVKDPAAENMNPQTVDIPLVGSVACGMPIFAEENIEAMIPVAKSLARPGSRYFLLRAVGDSMNLAGIEDGDLVLVRQQITAESGDLVVALIDDEATVKEFHRSDDMVVLKPRSRNKKHQPIILTEDFQIQGVAIKTIKDFS
jgi:repressor LexA